jgi:hypothetical protein
LAQSAAPSSILPATSEKFVILIQDAHAVIDAQENIAKILGHLQKNYGIRLTALEGARGRLEPVLLRTFPDPGVKRKILAGYENRAELSGPEMAAVLQEGTGEYRGMEDWGLYERNYFAYLRAQEKKDPLLVRWDTFKQTLDHERAKLYGPELNEFQEVRENFLNERTSLLDLLIYIFGFQGLLKTASGYQELPGLIESIGYEKSGKPEALAPLVRKIADEFKQKYLRGLGVKTETNFYNRYQAFMTGQVTAGQMLQYLVRLGNESGKSVKLSPALKKLLGHAEILSEIKGGRLYDELESFLSEVESSLIKTPAERELAEKYRRLYILKDLIHLELTHEQLGKLVKSENQISKYETISNDKNFSDLSDQVLSLKDLNFEFVSDFGGGDPGFDEMLKPALEFYRLALERDDAFYENIMALMEEETPRTPDSELQTPNPKLRTIIVVTGGFHTRGLERILKEKGVAYAVVTPKIASLAGSENYAKVMRGDVSFKEDLKATYFDALMRHAAKSLTEALPLQDRVRTLKVWRDNVIRELAEEGRITEAGKYLPYIDEIIQSTPEAANAIGTKHTKEEALGIVRKELEKFKKDSFERIWKTFEFQLDIFTDGLKQLITKKDLSTQSVSALLDRASQTKPSFLGPVQSLDPSIAVIEHLVLPIGGSPGVDTGAEEPATSEVDKSEGPATPSAGKHSELRAATDSKQLFEGEPRLSEERGARSGMAMLIGAGMLIFSLTLGSFDSNVMAAGANAAGAKAVELASSQMHLKKFLKKGVDPGKTISIARRKENTLKRAGKEATMTRVSRDLTRTIEDVYAGLPQSERAAMHNLAMYTIEIESGFRAVIQKKSKNRSVMIGMGLGQVELATVEDNLNYFKLNLGPDHPHYRIYGAEKKAVAKSLGLPSDKALVSFVGLSKQAGKRAFRNALARAMLNDEFGCLMLLVKMHRLLIDFETGRRSAAEGQKTFSQFDANPSDFYEHYRGSGIHVTEPSRLSDAEKEITGYRKSFTPPQEATGKGGVAAKTAGVAKAIAGAKASVVTKAAVTTEKSMVKKPARVKEAAVVPVNSEISSRSNVSTKTGLFPMSMGILGGMSFIGLMMAMLIQRIRSGGFAVNKRVWALTHPRGNFKPAWSERPWPRARRGGIYARRSKVRQVAEAPAGRSEVRLEIPQNAIIAEHPKLGTVMDAKLLDPKQFQKLAKELYQLESICFPEERREDEKEVLTQWEGYLKDPSPYTYVYVLMNIFGDVVGSTRGSILLPIFGVAWLNQLMSLDDGIRGKGSFLLDSFLSEMHRRGMTKIQWGSADSKKFYSNDDKGFLDIREKTGILKQELQTNKTNFLHKVDLFKDPLDPKFESLRAFWGTQRTETSRNMARVRAEAWDEQVFTGPLEQEQFSGFIYSPSEHILRTAEGYEIPEFFHGGRNNTVFHTDEGRWRGVYFRLPKHVDAAHLRRYISKDFKAGAEADVVPPSAVIRISGTDFLVVRAVEPVPGTRSLQDLLLKPLEERYVQEALDLFRRMVRNQFFLLDPRPGNIVVGRLDGRLGAWVVDADLLFKSHLWSSQEIATNFLKDIERYDDEWSVNNDFKERVVLLLRNWNSYPTTFPDQATEEKTTRSEMRGEQLELGLRYPGEIRREELARLRPASGPQSPDNSRSNLPLRQRSEGRTRPDENNDQAETRSGKPDFLLRPSLVVPGEAVRAEAWDETQSAALAEDIVKELQLRRVRHVWTQQPFHATASFGNHLYHNEGYNTDESGHYDLMRLHNLFFMDEVLYARLSAALRERLGGNAIVIPDFRNSILATTEEGKSGLKFYTAATILAMLNTDLGGTRFVDAGAGDGILSLVASKLGAAELVLIEKEAVELAKARKSLERNGLRSGKDFLLVSGSLENPAEIIRQIPSSHSPIAMAVNIGRWPQNYGTTTNESVLRMIPEFDRSSGRVAKILLGGYELNLRKSGSPEFVGAHGPKSDKAFVMKLGFFVRNEQARSFEAISLIAERPRSEVRVADTPILGLTRGENLPQTVLGILRGKPGNVDAVRSDLREKGKTGIALAKDEFDQAGERLIEGLNAVDAGTLLSLTSSVEKLRPRLGEFTRFGDVNRLADNIIAAVKIPVASAEEGEKLIRYDSEKLRELSRQLTLANAGLVPKIHGVPVSVLTNHSDREVAVVLDAIRPLELRQLAVLYETGGLGRIYRSLTKWFTPLNYHDKDPNKLASEVVSKDGRELWFWISTRDLRLHDLGVGCNSNLEAPELMDPSAKQVVKLLIQHMIFKYLSLSPNEQREIALKPALLKNYLKDMPGRAFINFGEDGLSVSVADFVAAFQASSSIDQAA